MFRRYCPHISALLTLALLIAAVPAQASKKKDLVKQAEQAVEQSRFEDAEKYYCEAADNGKDKKLQSKCDEYRAKNAAQRDQDQNAIKQALAAANVYHDFNKAIALLKSVKTSALATIAKRHLEETIPQLQRADEERRKQAEKAKAEQEAQLRAQQQALQQGIEAYNKSDFLTARKRLLESLPADPQKVHQYLQLIDDYEAAFNAGWAYERKNRAKEALASYRKAQRIKPDGPHQVAARIAKVKEMIAAIESTKEQEPATPAAASEDDALAAGISDFYAGNYVAAETRLAAYPGSNDLRRALAHFYMGASKLTRYLLAGSPTGEKQLLDSAVSEFLQARRTQGFSAPQEFVSPKIIEVFQQATPQTK